MPRNGGLIDMKKLSWIISLAAVVVLVSPLNYLRAQSGPTVWIIPSLARVSPTAPAGSGLTADFSAARERSVGLSSGHQARGTWTVP
jgi:hypothetical protein